MRHGLFLALALLAVASVPPAGAGESYGLANEALVTLKGTVVDVACEVAKLCAPQCGEGKHQLGLRTPDGKLFLAAKSNVDFMGSIRDLLPYCGRLIIVDALTTENGGTRLLMVQRYRLTEVAPWRPTDRALVDWAKANNLAPDSDAAKQWMRNDPLVKAAVAKRGRLGIPE